MRAIGCKHISQWNRAWHWISIGRIARIAALVCSLLALCAATCDAQDLAPRAYWPAPHGTKVAVFGYAHTSGEVHLIRRIRPGLWASIEANYFFGGRQTVAGSSLEDVQDNSRFGATLAIPFKGRSGIKLSYACSVETAFGTHFDQFLVSYQVLLN